MLHALGRKEFSKGIAKHNRVSAVGVLNYVNVARCCGIEVDFRRKSGVLVLDEPTASLDAEAEYVPFFARREREDPKRRPRHRTCAL